MEDIKKQPRIEWVDIVKFLGIWAIYLGHWGSTSGYALNFVFAYHVPLFFFISGCMSNYDKERNFFRYIIKKIKTILLPFYGFGIVTVGLNSILNNTDLIDIKINTKLVLSGCIRNQFFASGLWFLSCLFVMEILFKILKYLHFRVLILGISFLIYSFTKLYFVPDPSQSPQMFYNIDSALYYLIFFAIGYCIYPYLCSFLELDINWKKCIYTILLIITGYFSVNLFFEKNVLAPLYAIQWLEFVMPIILPMILILFNVLVARLLCGIHVFSEIGQNTLFLCGNEWIVKTLYGIFVYFVTNIGSTVNSPLAAHFYTFIMFLINLKLLIPIEKTIIAAIKRNYPIPFLRKNAEDV